ncbi:thiamine-phosphate kinase [Nocardioides kongjuensis]|uniref:Thiamine-monophosphate kinase n=1 Tax=Nocardioides kongjuensis TaxID=349522 RepID=A0A852RMT1_9ACTN|nr:thiamine-phosphate kinase [Nocardioides kongjuensis]NYD29344.1 thiamine-monophosphate kinase [Nocardioides kongjuensis]
MPGSSSTLRLPTVAHAGEFGLINAIRSILPQGSHVIVGPGDDCAVVRGQETCPVISTDLMVEGRHFRRDWSPAADIGARAAAQNLSDVNAMGGTATSLTLGLALPHDLPAAWVMEFVRGFAEEAGSVGASVVGGDLTSSDTLMLAVTVLGSCPAPPVLRSGARPGDTVAIAGRQGWSAAGLALLERGVSEPQELLKAYHRPTPPYAAGPEAARAGATVMLDVSDGLVADARHLAQASNVVIDLWTDELRLVGPPASGPAGTGVDRMQCILSGGDDHPLLACFNRTAELPDGWTQVGAVLPADGGQPMVTVDGEAYDGPAGWTHF